MGQRAYLLIDVKDTVNQQEFIQIIRELEAMVEVDFADPVVGNWDIIAMIEAPITVQAVVKELAQRLWVKNIEIAKIQSVLERQLTARG